MVGVAVGISVGVFDGIRVGGKVEVGIRNNSSTLMEQDESRSAINIEKIIFFISTKNPFKLYSHGERAIDWS